MFIAELPHARSVRGAEPHTHGMWSISSFGSQVTDRAYVGTYVRAPFHACYHESTISIMGCNKPIGLYGGEYWTKLSLDRVR